MTAVRYQGEEDAQIAFGTDVWLQTTDGAEVDLESLLDGVSLNDLEGMPSSLERWECETCAGVPMHGVFAPVNGNGIERCDECDLYPGDFEAAVALRDRIEEQLGLAGLEIWYEHA